MGVGHLEARRALRLSGSGRPKGQVLVASVTELKNRGVKDICIACMDGLKDFPQAVYHLRRAKPLITKAS
jgi:transposase-like protein